MTKRDTDSKTIWTSPCGRYAVERRAEGWMRTDLHANQAVAMFVDLPAARRGELPNFSKAKRDLCAAAAAAGLLVRYGQHHAEIRTPKGVYPKKFIMVWESGWCNDGLVDYGVSRGMTMSETHAHLGLGGGR